MRLEKFEYSKKDGLIIDDKKYGWGIKEVRFDSVTITIYVSAYTINHFEESDYKEYNNPIELSKYENVRIIEE